MNTSKKKTAVPVEDRRVVRTRAAVLAAGTEILIERGVNGITIDGITERTGIAKTTVYRHWPSTAELVLDIVAGQALSLPDPDTGDALEDLRICLGELSRALAETPHRIALLGVLELAARDPEAAALHRDFREARIDPLIHVFDRAVATGRIPPDPRPRETLGILAGSIFVKAILIGEVTDDEEISRLVDRVVNSGEVA